MTSKRDVILHGAAVFLLSAYPLSVVFRANLGVIPIRPSAFLLVVAANLALIAVLFVALRLFSPRVTSRAAWLSVFFLLFGAYTTLQGASALGWLLLPDRPIVGAAYTGMSMLVATAVVRPWRERKWDPIPFLIIAVVLVGTNAALGLSRVLAFSPATADHTSGWQRAANDLIGHAAPADAPSTTASGRDIYYIILDGFGRADAMARLYDLDISPFEASLRSKGFHVADRASTNYVQTYLSIASSTNLGYLNDLANVLGRASTDRNPLMYLIDRNALMKLAKRTGYRVIGIGSDFMATEHMSSVDVCLCAQYGSGSAEQTLFVANPLATFVLGPRFFGAHRRKVLDAFEGLEAKRDPGKPAFVFAHVLIPHPPFVFNADGTPPPAFGAAMFQDGSHYPGSRADYRRGYRGQVEFLTHRLAAMIETLLGRPGPQPVIVIHGDHGSGLGLNWESAEQTDMAERTGIFAAYYFPDALARPYPTITPLNGARLLSNNYLGTALPLLEDKTYFSTWGRPYDFIPIQTGGDR